MIFCLSHYYWTTAVEKKNRVTGFGSYKSHSLFLAFLLKDASSREEQSTRFGSQKKERERER